MPLRQLHRSPSLYWLAVAAVAVVTALAVSQLVGRARAEAARYGRLRPVVSATRDAPAGRALSGADVEVRRLPAALVPEGALTSTADANGRTVVVALFAGEPVLRRHLAPWGKRGVAALLPPGTRGVTVPGGPAASRLSRGDVVDVLATFDPAAAQGHEPTFPVATAAVVLDVTEQTVTVAVDPEEAKRVAYAVAKGSVSLALSSPGESPRR